MTQDNDTTPAQPPEGFQEYADSRFGFKVFMPKRFEILPDTIDPLARMLRGLDDLSEEEAKDLQPRLPIGFFDPDVLGELEDGSKQPLRLIEYEALSGRDEPLTDEEIEQMFAEMREYLPETLAGAQMPGYEFLGVRETALGLLPALAFEYRWDGVRPGYFGGDHARMVWALGPTAMFHVYHHCSGEVWGARRCGARRDPRVVRAHGARRSRGRGAAGERWPPSKRRRRPATRRRSHSRPGRPPTTRRARHRWRPRKRLRTTRPGKARGWTPNSPLGSPSGAARTLGAGRRGPSGGTGRDDLRSVWRGVPGERRLLLRLRAPARAAAGRARGRRRPRGEFVVGRLHRMLLMGGRSGGDPRADRVDLQLLARPARGGAAARGPRGVRTD